MKIKKHIIFLLALVLIFSSSACKKKVAVDEVDTATNVTVSKVTVGDIESEVTYTGEVKAAENASVSSKVSGSIRKINVKTGDYVTAGSVLVVLDDSQYRLAYNQASAAYSSAVAAKSNASASYNNVTGGSLEQSRINISQAISNAQAAYDTALDNYNRQKALYDIGAVSKVALDSAETSLNNARVALDAAKTNEKLNEDVVIPQTEASASAGLSQANAGVSQAKAALDIASSNLQNCIVTAPMTGYITAVNAVLGQMASPGYALFEITNTSAVEIELNVTESVISYLTTETKATVNIKSAEIENIDAEVSMVANVKNPATGMYPIKIAIPNADNKIKVGMLSEVSLVTDGAEDVLTVDSNSVIFKNDTYYVYVAQGDKAVKKEIVPGVSDGKRTAVLSGLEAGDTVIVDGKEFLSEKNDSIRIVK